MDVFWEMKYYGFYCYFIGVFFVFMFGGGVREGMLYGKFVLECFCIVIENFVLIIDMYVMIYCVMGISLCIFVDIE